MNTGDMLRLRTPLARLLPQMAPEHLAALACLGVSSVTQHRLAIAAAAAAEQAAAETAARGEEACGNVDGAAQRASDLYALVAAIPTARGVGWRRAARRRRKHARRR